MRGNSDNTAAYHAQYYKDNKEKKTVYDAKYRKANKEKLSQYRQDNKEKKAAYDATYVWNAFSQGDSLGLKATFWVIVKRPIPFVVHGAVWAYVKFVLAIPYASAGVAVIAVMHFTTMLNAPKKTEFKLTEFN